MNYIVCEKLKILYLFLSEQGWMTKAQKQKFDQVGLSLDASFSQEQGKIIGESDRILAMAGNGNEAVQRYITIVDEIKKIAVSSTLQASNERKSLLWTLVNLIYGGEDSENKKQIVHLLLEAWGIAPAILDEMNDAAQTFLDLDKHKEWVKTLSYGDAAPLMAEIEKSWKDTTESINTLIALG